jgi:Flp pilus assembly protein TadG
MALVLPVLLLVIGGLVDFGRAYYAQVVISNAAREGARMAAMGYATSAVNTRVTASIGTSLGALTTSTPAITACPNVNNAASVTVSIPNGASSAQFHWLVLNVIPSFFGVTLPSPNLSATGSMRCQG